MEMEMEMEKPFFVGMSWAVDWSDCRRIKYIRSRALLRNPQPVEC